MGSFFFRRLAALIYDSFVLFSFWILATALALLLNRGESLLPYRVCFLLYLFVASGLFLGYFWCKSGQTLGMLAWRLKVIQHNGHPLSWKHASARYLLGCMSLLLAGLGFLWGFFSREKQSLYDKLAGTRVICAKKS